jgi:hypothetical protein
MGRYSKTGHKESSYFKKKLHEPNNNHLYKGLLSMMQNILS